MECSAFDKPYVACAWALLGIFRGELHTLAFPQQFEDGAAHRAAVEEVLDSTFVPDEPETLVDQQPSDSAVWHTQALRSDPPGGILGGSAGSGDREKGATLSGCSPAEASQHQQNWEIQASLGSSMSESQAEADL